MSSGDRTITVRQWFRLDRAAMWQNAEHPAHDCASEIDRIAAKITEATNLTPGYHVEEEFDLTWPFVANRYMLWMPREIVYAARLQEAAEALNQLLYLAWPLSDREKYDDNYRMWETLRRSTGPGDLWK